MLCLYRITLVSLLLATLGSQLTAQELPDRFEGTDTSTSGGSFHLEYTNDELAGTTVTITLTDPLDPTSTKDIELDVGADGRIDTEIDVPSGWLGIFIDGPDSRGWMVDLNDGLVAQGIPE